MYHFLSSLSFCFPQIKRHKICTHLPPSSIIYTRFTSPTASNLIPLSQSSPASSNPCPDPFIPNVSSFPSFVVIKFVRNHIANASPFAKISCFSTSKTNNSTQTQTQTQFTRGVSRSCSVTQRTQNIQKPSKHHATQTSSVAPPLGVQQNSSSPVASISPAAVKSILFNPLINLIRHPRSALHARRMTLRRLDGLLRRRLLSRRIAGNGCAVRILLALAFRLDDAALRVHRISWAGARLRSLVGCGAAGVLR